MTQFTCKGVKQINNRISLNMTFTFTIRISRHFSSAQEFQMGNFQKYWSQNVGQDFFVLCFFHGWKILKVDGRDGREPQNLEKNASAGRFTCMHVTTYDQWSEADLEGACKGVCPPPPKIRKAYVIQRWLSSSTNNFFMNG